MPLSQAKFFYPFEQAQKGDAKAQVESAVRCFDGRRVLRPNMEEGDAWLKRALAQKHADAYELSALIYAEGRYGQAMDKQKALDYYKKAIQATPPDEHYSKDRLKADMEKLRGS